jgi:hypothetical protein
MDCFDAIPELCRNTSISLVSAVFLASAVSRENLKA